MEKIKELHIEDYYAELLKGKDLTIPSVKSWKLIQDRNKGREGNIAISEDDRKICYGEMYEGWEEVAKVFSALGITRDSNSRVLVIMPNVAQTCHFDYGGDITGAVVDFIDPTTSIDKIEEYIKKEKITDIVVSDLLYLQNIMQHSSKLKDELDIRNIILYKDHFLNSQMPCKIRAFSSMADVINKFSSNVIRYNDAVRNTRYSKICYDELSSDSVSLITHTSGTTTGLGKPIPITDLNRNALVKNYELAQFKYEPGMTMMHFIPYFAGYGAVNTVHLGLTQGLNLQQIPLFSPNKFGDFVEKYKSNIILGTPSCWLSMINNPKYKDIDLSFLVYASAGGGPLTVEEENKINEFLLSHGSKVLLTKGYGLSELGGCCIVTLDDYNNVGSIGVRHPLVDIKLQDVNTSRVLGDRETGRGEALVSSATMTTGKLDGVDLVSFVDIDGKKYLKTKDILERKNNGTYEYVERADRMFPRYDGYNIYPLNLEKVFKEFDEVEDCVVVPMFCEEKSGRLPKVYIKLKDGVQIPSKSDFISSIIKNAFLSNNRGGNGYIANFREIPGEFVFVDSIPKNTMDKDDYSSIVLNGIQGESYSVDVVENNMRVLNFSVSQNDSPKKLVK